jgi:hypothetical protein
VSTRSRSSIASSTPIRLEGALYFSFMTLATLGYGDVAPASAVARPLAMLEAVFGQLYLVVLVARLEPDENAPTFFRSSALPG